MPSRNCWSRNANQPFTQPPDLPGTRPSSRPRTWVSVDERGHPGIGAFPAGVVFFDPAHRAGAGLVDAQHPVGSGAGSHRAAWAIRAPWAVVQDTPYSAATSATARLEPTMHTASFSRSRAVTRPHRQLPVACVNVARGQACSRHTRRRLRHHNWTSCPDAGGSLTRRSGRSFTRPTAPHSGAGSLRLDGFDHDPDAPGAHVSDVEDPIPSRPNSSAQVVSFVHARGLTARVVEDLQHVEATSP